MIKEKGNILVYSQHQCTTSMAELGWKIQQQMSVCVNELWRHFVPEDDNEESVGVRAENEESGGVGVKNKEDRAESEETRDVEMGENGADMVDDAMDKTLH